MTPPLRDYQIAELVEAGPGLVGVVVPTVPCPHGSWQDDPDYCKRCWGRLKQLDPCWVDAAADTCTTCNGLTLVPTPRPVTNGPILPEYSECGSCYRGSPYHPLTTECDACDGKGTQGGEHDGATGWFCQSCWSEDFQPGDGRIPVGRLAVLTLAPYEMCSDDREHVCSDASWSPTGYIWHLHLDGPGETEHYLRLLGEPLPGDTIAICRWEPA